ncbi:hypothetical protein BZZ01_13530 [Nostocales cyanobacterium HT-58-2]|nr:hypothetical protein BZZ01_13530 [Nostocales cyanobacterium HT-58-2]
MSPEESKEKETVHLSVRGINARLQKTLKIEAVRRGISLGDLLNLILREWLEQNKIKIEE